jgi:hypothetical protein
MNARASFPLASFASPISLAPRTPLPRPTLTPFPSQISQTPSPNSLPCNNFAKAPGDGWHQLQSPCRHARLPATQHRLQPFIYQTVPHTFRHHGGGGCPLCVLRVSAFRFQSFSPRAPKPAPFEPLATEHGSRLTEHGSPVPAARCNFFSTFGFYPQGAIIDVDSRRPEP